MTGALTSGLMSPEIRKVVDPRASDSRANLGRIAMSHTDRSPVLVRASIPRGLPTGPHDTTRVTGRPRAVIRLRISQPRTTSLPCQPDSGRFRHQLLLPRPYLVLTKPLRLDIRWQRAASVKIGWKYLLEVSG